MRERTNEEALDLFADLLEPASEILSDKELAVIWRKEPRIKAVKFAIKNHKKAVIEIMARLDDAEPENYKVNVLTLPMKVIELLNRPEVQDLFTSQGQTKDAEGSGSATDNIKAVVR